MKSVLFLWLLFSCYTLCYFGIINLYSTEKFLTFSFLSLTTKSAHHSYFGNTFLLSKQMHDLFRLELVSCMMTKKSFSSSWHFSALQSNCIFWNTLSVFDIFFWLKHIFWRRFDGCFFFLLKLRANSFSRIYAGIQIFKMQTLGNESEHSLQFSVNNKRITDFYTQRQWPLWIIFLIIT